MTKIGDTWEIGSTVYYLDDEDKILVKEGRIKDVHEEIYSLACCKSAWDRRSKIQMEGR